MREGRREGEKEGGGAGRSEVLESTDHAGERREEKDIVGKLQRIPVVPL
jgi:hypothetical protein